MKRFLLGWMCSSLLFSSVVLAGVSQFSAKQISAVQSPITGAEVSEENWVALCATNGKCFAEVLIHVEDDRVPWVTGHFEVRPNGKLYLLRTFGLSKRTEPFNYWRHNEIEIGAVNSNKAVILSPTTSLRIVKNSLWSMFSENAPRTELLAEKQTGAFALADTVQQIATTENHAMGIQVQAASAIERPGLILQWQRLLLKQFEIGNHDVSRKASEVIAAYEMKEPAAYDYIARIHPFFDRQLVGLFLSDETRAKRAALGILDDLGWLTEHPDPSNTVGSTVALRTMHQAIIRLLRTNDPAMRNSVLDFQKRIHETFDGIIKANPPPRFTRQHYRILKKQTSVAEVDAIISKECASIL